MVLRLMSVTAAVLALGAAALLLAPEAPAERVATRAEMLAAHPPHAPVPVACGPAHLPERHTEI